MTDEDHEKESKNRAASSTTALAKFGAVAAAGAIFGPPGAVLATVAVLLPGHAIGLLKEKRARRISRFHEDLLNGVPEEEVPRLVAKLASDDYASILEKVYQDDEGEKVELYARLLRYLASTAEGATRGKELERHMIRSLRELAASDLITLRKLADLEDFPAKAAPMETMEGGAVRIDEHKEKLRNENFRKHEQFIGSLSPLEAAGLRRLEYAGMVQRVDVLGGSRYDMTPIGWKLLLAVGSLAGAGEVMDDEVTLKKEWSSDGTWYRYADPRPLHIRKASESKTVGDRWFYGPDDNLEIRWEGAPQRGWGIWVHDQRVDFSPELAPEPALGDSIRAAKKLAVDRIAIVKSEKIR